MGIAFIENEMEWVQDQVSMRWSWYRMKGVRDGVGTGLSGYRIEWEQD